MFSHHATTVSRAATRTVSEPPALARPEVSRLAWGPRILLGWGSGIAIAHALGALVAPSALWGVHHYAFVPAAWALAGFAAVAFVLGLAARGAARARGAATPDAITGEEPRWTRRRVAIALITATGAGAAAGAVFWLARARHLFLGDALVLVSSVQSREFHPLEPLTMVLQRQIHDFASPWLRSGNPPDHEVAWRTIALGSVVAGVLFVAAAWALARQLVRAAAPVGTGAPRGVTVALVAGVLLAQGYVQLFFGYVENYAFLAAAIAWYLVTALAWLNGRGSLLPVLVSCLAAVCLHLSAAALLPSLAWLVARSVMRGRRPALAGELVAGGVVVLLVAALLSAAGSGYSLVATLLATVQRIASGEGEIAGYAFSWRHLRDFASGQLLIAPAGLALLVPAWWLARRREGERPPARAFLLVLAATVACVVAAAGDSNLGYARNWDLLAPMGVVFTATTAFLLLEAFPGMAARRRWLGVVLAVSVFHTAPWIAGNASFERALARFQTLPLGAGRTESTLGFWYASQGRPSEAEPWLARSLDANPANARAHFTLGQVYLMTGRPEPAVRAFGEAARLRPGIARFRLGLIDALVRAGREDEALVETRALVAREAMDPRRWALLGAVLLSVGREAEARAALERATVLAPNDPLYRDLLAGAAREDTFERIVRARWLDLVST